MDLMVCVGSSCHLKGSKEVIEKLDKKIKEYQVEDKINLKGSFCLGKCGDEGVSIKLGEEVYSIRPEEIDQFFEEVILPEIR